jgi:lipid-binding SYLF domain-containing protein
LNAKNLVLTLAIVLTVGCSAKGDTANQQRNSIQQMRDSTLTQLYKTNPEVRDEIARSVGYAVFTNNSSKIFVVGFGGGYGVVKDLKSGKYTYMKMAQAGAGLGIGVKELKRVMVFHDRTAINNFIKDGYVVGADANAAAKYDDKGVAPVGATASAVDPSEQMLKTLKTKVSVYEITEKGLAVQAMLTGSKYWPDDELNK